MAFVLLTPFAVMTNSDDNHYLNDFLEQRLPAIGLDFETYGPYITGGLLFPNELDESSEFSPEQEEELTNVLDLLLASSETHSDDVDLFHNSLRSELLERREQHRKHTIEIQGQEREQAKVIMEERRRLEIEEAVMQRQEEQAGANKKGAVISEEQRQATLNLVQRFGYEEVSDDEDDKATGSTTTVITGGSGSTVSGAKKKGTAVAAVVENPNRVDVAKIQKEKNQALKQEHHHNKKAAQEETKKAKVAREQAKEERRKRAQKGERRG